MAISKKELKEEIENNDFRETRKIDKIEKKEKTEEEQLQAESKGRRKVYMTGKKPKGRPKIMEGYGRVRLSLYISEELDNRLERMLDRNVETKNQLIIRLLEESCEAKEEINKQIT